MLKRDHERPVHPDQQHAQASVGPERREDGAIERHLRQIALPGYRPALQGAPVLKSAISASPGGSPKRSIRPTTRSILHAAEPTCPATATSALDCGPNKDASSGASITRSAAIDQAPAGRRIEDRPPWLRGKPAPRASAPSAGKSGRYCSRTWVSDPMRKASRRAGVERRIGPAIRGGERARRPDRRGRLGRRLGAAPSASPAPRPARLRETMRLEALRERL